MRLAVATADIKTLLMRLIPLLWGSKVNQSTIRGHRIIIPEVEAIYILSVDSIKWDSAQFYK